MTPNPAREFCSGVVSFPLGAWTGSITGSSSLFRGQPEPLGQGVSGLGDRQALGSCPQVQDVALGGAGNVKTLKDVLLKIHGEAAAVDARWPVYRARAAALGPAALEAIPPVQLAQYLF